MTQTFSVENFKGCKSVTLSPDGSLVVIAGANGAGKSSFIDAFVELFDPKGIRLTPKPIKDGAATAEAVFEDSKLGYRITRRWTKNDSGTLTVTALDGAKYSKPTELVRELTGGLIFDPVAFLNMDDRKQRDALLAKVELPFDLEDLARKKAAALEARVEAGREVKRLQGALSAIPKPEPETPSVETSPSEIVAELQEAQNHNNNSQRAAERLREYTANIESNEQRIARLREEIQRLTADLDDLEAARTDALADSSAEPIDLVPIQERLRNLDEINQAVRSKQEYIRAGEALQLAEDAHAVAQGNLDSIEGAKRDGLAKATFPVAGLSVDDEGVTFDGIPFGQVNSAARLKTAFAIATAGDPKLKLVIVKDGDLLDASSLDAVRELADERGYTVLVERDRDESRQIGFTIVDGELAS